MTLVWSPGFTQWDPSLITTALWLDAADGTTVFSDAGTTQAVAGSSTVQQWNDKSGNSRHVSQSTSGSRPAYSSSVINGRNVLTFITDDFLQRTSPGLVTGASERSMFVVYKPNTTGESNFIAGQVEGGNNTASWFGLMHRNDVVAGDPYLALFAADITDSATPTTSTKIGNAIYDGTTAFLYRNGAQIASGARTLVTNVGVNFNVGRELAGSSFMNGQVAEIIFTHSASGTDTRQRIEGYLAHKWGLTANLPNDHPYKVNPPAP